MRLALCSIVVLTITGTLAAAEGQVFLRSEPNGAEVLLDVVNPSDPAKHELKSIGKTPGLMRLPEGRHMIVMRLAKYKDTQAQLDITGTGIVKPDPYKLEVTTYPVDVILLDEGWNITVDKTPKLVDEKPVTAPATVELIEGKHEVALTKEGFEPMLKSVDVKDSKEKISLDFSAEKPKKAAKKIVVPQYGPVDLLKIANVKDSINGEWELKSGELVSPAAGATKLPFKYAPPEEYTVTANVERVNGNEAFAIGLVVGGKQCVALIDGWESKISGIEMISGKRASDNVTKFQGRQVLGIKTSQVQVSVRRALIEVSVNGRKLTSWKPEPEKLSLSADWNITQKDQIFIGAYNSCFKITRLEVEAAR